MATTAREDGLARLAFSWGPDVVLDGSHEHGFQRLYPGYAVVNRSADREGRAGTRAIYPSRAHAAAMGEPNGRVIHSAVDERRFQPQPWGAGNYLLWLGPVDVAHKRVDRAIQVAIRARRPLVIAGTGQIQHEGFVGPVYGEGKVRLISGALAVLVTGEIEAGPLTALEAACCGTPVIGWAQGGTVEYVGHEASGYLVADVAEAADAVDAAGGLDEDGVRDWAVTERGRERMLAAYESELIQAAAGVRA